MLSDQKHRNMYVNGRLGGSCQRNGKKRGYRKYRYGNAACDSADSCPVSCSYFVVQPKGKQAVQDPYYAGVSGKRIVRGDVQLYFALQIPCLIAKFAKNPQKRNVKNYELQMRQSPPLVARFLFLI